ncbi:hypothetical protein ACFSYD_18845 [Paracoccus aerius]
MHKMDIPRSLSTFYGQIPGCHLLKAVFRTKIGWEYEMGGLLFDNGDDAALSRRLRRQAAAGKLIRIHPGIFMEPGGEPETLAIRRNWPQVVAHLFPDGVVTDRSGFDARPIEWEKSETDARYLFVSRPGRPGQFTLPGLVISVRDGIGPVPGEDMPYIGTWIAGPNRKFLDNIMPSRARSGPARTLGRTRVEEKLDELCRDHGEDRLNQIRDAARALAGQIDRQEAFIELDQLIGALLSTRSSPLKTQSGRARAEGRPYDPGCMERLLILSRHLSDHPRLPCRMRTFPPTVAPTPASSKPISPTSSKGRSSQCGRPRTSSSKATFPRAGPRTDMTCSGPI